MYIFACISAHITEIFFKIHIWDTGHIHYECYKFGCARSIGKGTLCDDLCMCSSVSWLPIGGIVLKSHTTCVLHFSTGIEGLASSCVCLISSNRLDKRLGGHNPLSLSLCLIGRTGNAKSPVDVEGDPPLFNQAMISSQSADLAFQSREVFCCKRIGISRSAKTSLPSHFTWPDKPE